MYYVNKTNLLTGFPKHLFGSAKRKIQDSIRLKSEKIAKASLGGFSTQFKSFIPQEFIKDKFESKRKRIYCNEVTFWLWMAQMLNFNASCSAAVSMLQAWRLKASLPAISSKTPAYCKARGRLPIKLIEQLITQVLHVANRRVREQDRWKGFIIKSVDGSSVQLMDTEENQKKYPQPSMQKPGCGFPVMKILGLLNHATGMWEKCLTAHPNEHDSLTMRSLIEHLTERCLLLADRAFCSFEIILRLKNKGIECVMRLHQMREKGYTLRKGKRIGKNERLVTWIKPKVKPKTSDLTQTQWDELDSEIEMRMVVFNYEDRNGEKKRMILATTLLDNVTYDWLSIVNIYATRWDIELRLRDVKTTMKMEALNVQTPAMARKTMAMAVLGYNLVKAISQEACIQTSKPIESTSFKEMLDWINSGSSLFIAAATKSKKYLVTLYESFIEIASTKLLNRRPGRWEVRRIKKRPKPFPRLQKTRQEYREEYQNGDLIPGLS